MLIFIHTPALAMTLGLRSLDEGAQRPAGTRTEVRARPTAGAHVTGRRRWRLAKSLRLAH